MNSPRPATGRRVEARRVNCEQRRIQTANEMNHLPLGAAGCEAGDPHPDWKRRTGHTLN